MKSIFRADVPPEKLTIFRADVPPEELTKETDAFGHRDYAETIAAVLVEAEPPFTLGLFGPWGVGKTTIIEEVGRRLPKSCAFAIFDAWRYEGDALRRHFLTEISRQLHKKKQLDAGYNRKRELEELTTPVSSVRPAGWSVNRVSLVRAAINSTVVGVVAFFLMTRYLPLDASTLGAVVSAVVTLGLFVATSVTQIFDLKFETVTRPRLEDPERFTEKFENLLGHLKPSRLVVAIDNIDRCSPERIEQIFETLNTFLEPAGAVGHAQGLSNVLSKKRANGERKEAVFLVAADDEALRRHLEAREARASLPSVGEGVAVAVSSVPLPLREDVGRYADEYLRKIFKASIPIKPLLDEDMRTYINRELDRFVSVHPLADEERKRLVEVIAAALKRNPRRVRQFVKNLELRLRLIRARELSGAIASELSGEVLLVAKLTLLEEEWPRSFAMVARDPRLLDQWHAKQPSGDLGGVPDGKDQAFRSFLNASRGVRSEHLPAFLSLKQSQEELDLPRFGEFRDALRSGDGDVVAEVLVDGDVAVVRRYAEQLVPMLRRELLRGYLDAARSIVETAAAEARLATESATLELLAEAARDAKLRPELRLADPSSVLRVGQQLAEEDFGLLLEPFTDLVSFKREGKERLSQVIDALAEVADKLPARSGGAVTESLRSDDLVEAFADYLPLAERAPTLLPTEAGAKALEAFAGDFDVSSPAFRIVQLRLDQDPPSDEQDRFLTVATDRVVSRLTAGDTGGGFQEEASELVAAAQKLSRPNESAIDTALSSLEPVLTHAIRAGIAYQILDLAAVCAALKGDAGSPVIDPFVQTCSQQDPDVLISYALASGADLKPVMKNSLLPVLAQLADGEHPAERQQRAADAILLVSPNDEAGHLACAVVQTATLGEFAAVETHLHRHSELLKDTLPKIAEALLTRAQSLGDSGAAPAFPALLQLVDAMSDEQRERLRGLLRQTIITSGANSLDDLATVLQQAEGEAKFAPDYELLVCEVWDSLKGQPDPQQSLFTYVAERFPRLDPDRRAAFITQFGLWIVQLPQARLTLAQNLAGIPDLKAGERTKLVDKIIEAEGIEVDVNARAGLLQAARGIEGLKGSAAAKRIQERLAALAGGSAEDQQVHSLLTQE